MKFYRSEWEQKGALTLGQGGHFGADVIRGNPQGGLWMDRQVETGCLEYGVQLEEVVSSFEGGPAHLKTYCGEPSRHPFAESSASGSAHVARTALPTKGPTQPATKLGGGFAIQPAVCIGFK